MIKALQKKGKQIIGDYIYANLGLINVDAGDCKYNFKCHMNAVHHALKNDENQVALVMYNMGSRWNVHFLNVDKDGRFIDNTIGEWSRYTEYRFVRMISKSEFRDIDEIFAIYRRYLTLKIPRLMRRFVNCNF